MASSSSGECRRCSAAYGVQSSLVRGNRSLAPWHAGTTLGVSREHSSAITIFPHKILTSLTCTHDLIAPCLPRLRQLQLSHPLASPFLYSSSSAGTGSFSTERSSSSHIISVSLELFAKSFTTTTPCCMVIAVFVRLTTLHCRGLPGYHHWTPLAILNSARSFILYGCVGMTSTLAVDPRVEAPLRRFPFAR